MKRDGGGFAPGQLRSEFGVRVGLGVEAQVQSALHFRRGSSMTERFAVALFLANAVGGGLVVRLADQLYRRFAERHPDEASRRFAAAGVRDYNKFTFFWDEDNMALIRADAVVWRLRERLRRALVAWFVVSAIGFALLVCAALFDWAPWVAL